MFELFFTVLMKLRGNKTLRLLDAFFGRVLIFLLSFFRKKRPLPNSIDTIGLLKLSGIGDLILLSGIIQDLRAFYPRAKIILFCGEDNGEIASFIPTLDQVILLSVANLVSSVKLLRAFSLTVLLDFGQWSKIDALLSYFSGALYLVGFQTARQHRHQLYDRVCLHRPDVHEIENFRSIVQCLNISSSSLPTLKLRKNTALLKPGGKFCIFHPWPSGYKSHLKEWPASHWVTLGEVLIANGYEILISGSKNNFVESESLTETLNKNSGTHNSKNISGKVSLNQLGHLIQKAKFTVSVNTGIMHFAACFDRPLIALHGPTSIKRWGPLGLQAIAIAPDNPSCGYLNLGFEYPKNPPECMVAISPQKIVKKLETIGLISLFIHKQPQESGICQRGALNLSQALPAEKPLNLNKLSAGVPTKTLLLKGWGAAGSQIQWLPTPAEPDS